MNGKATGGAAARAGGGGMNGKATGGAAARAGGGEGWAGGTDPF